jgi:multidrug efflux pump subunit AcrA (membrane-fusion protein)
MAVAVVVVGCLAYAGISVRERISAGRAAAQAAGAETAVVRRGTLQVTVGASGSLSPEDEVSLAFQAGGPVAEVPVEAGDVVRAGSVLARLDVSWSSVCAAIASHDDASPKRTRRAAAPP